MKEASISLPSISMKSCLDGSKYQWESCIFPPALYRYDSEVEISWWLDPCCKNKNCNLLLQHIRWMQTFHAHSSERRNGSLWTDQVALNQILLRGTVNSTNKPGTRLECSQFPFQDHWRWKVTYTHIDIFLWSPRGVHWLLISFGICSMDCTSNGWDCKEIHGEKNGCSKPTSCYPPFSNELCIKWYKLLLKLHVNPCLKRQHFDN